MADDREMSLAVVGIDYPNTDKAKSNRRFEIALCVPGEPVVLRPEPKNPHDENAVAVFSARGTQLGYLASARAAFISRKLKEEEATAIFQSEGATVAYIRIRFGGGAPTLPPERPAPAWRDPDEVIDPPADDFYPDPDGPDW